MMTNTRQTAPPASGERRAMKSTHVATGIGSLLNPSKLQSAAQSPAAIAEKAYEIWLAQGQEPGRDQEHWFEAEQQLRHGQAARPLGNESERKVAVNRLRSVP